MSDRTEEKELAVELGFFVNEFGWAVRNDEPRGTYEGANGTQYQLSLWNALIIARTELAALRQEVTRLTKSLAAADAYFPATALEVVNLREENERLKGALEKCQRFFAERPGWDEARELEDVCDEALSSSPAQEQK